MKGVLTEIDFIRDSETVQFSFNLTAPVPVLSNGIVSLLNATITLYTTKKSRGSDEYDKYKLSGSGRETILGELTSNGKLSLRGNKTMFTLQVKPASIKPGFRIGPSDWSIQRIQSFGWLRFKLV